MHGTIKMTVLKNKLFLSRIYDSVMNLLQLIEFTTVMRVALVKQQTLQLQYSYRDMIAKIVLFK